MDSLDSGRGAMIRRHSLIAARGFSIVELVVVIVILAILAAFALPLLNTTETQVGWFQEQVRAAVRHAQKQAIAQRRTVHVCVSASALNLGYNAGCTTPVLSLATGAAYSISTPSGVTLSSSPTTFTFNPLGQASAAATLSVSGRTVTVLAETGYVQ